MTPAAVERRTLPLSPEEHTAWRRALDLWGVELHDARLAPDAHEGSFAWFGFPPSVTIDPVELDRVGARPELESVFAHEIGHHVLSPSTRVLSLVIRQQMGRAIEASLAVLPDLGRTSAYLANLWSDMIINERVRELQRDRDPRVEPGMVRLWRGMPRPDARDRLWWVVLHAYEQLWELPDGTLCAATPPSPPKQHATARSAAEAKRAAREGEPSPDDVLAPPRPLVDAALLADTVRTFGADPVPGALRCGMILAPYLDDERSTQTQGAGAACAGGQDAGTPTSAEIAQALGDPRLDEEPVHPAIAAAGVTVTPTPVAAQGGGQAYDLSRTLAVLGGLPRDDVLRAWYLEQARRWVRPYREPDPRHPADPALPGALTPWEIGDDLDALDWIATLTASPVVVPGVTTRQREWLDDPPPRTQRGLDLDLFIDSSGSMPYAQNGSPALLAGAIVILSVLAGGGRVRVTSFSGAGQVAGTDRFTRRQDEAIDALLTSFHGGTTFPLDLLASRYRGLRHEEGVRRHLVVLSDDGLSSMFGAGQGEYGGVAAEVRRVLDTGTLVLLDSRHSVAAEAAAAGYDVVYLETLDDAPEACAELARGMLRETVGTEAVRRG